VDVESGLIRSVTTTAVRDGQPASIHESFEDYRKSDGLRIPMHRVVRVDDGPRDLAVTVDRFQLLQR
jgi:uncharacterized protein (UPF0248 family)